MWGQQVILFIKVKPWKAYLALLLSFTRPPIKSQRSAYHIYFLSLSEDVAQMQNAHKNKVDTELFREKWPKMQELSQIYRHNSLIALADLHFILLIAWLCWAYIPIRL